MNNINTTPYDLGSLQLGDNQYETGVLSLSAGTSVVEGDMLKRNAANGKFEKLTNPATETCVALAEAAVSNLTGTTIDAPCRAIIAGRVRANKVSIAGTMATKVQLDLIRRTGMVPITVTNVSKKEE